MTRINLVPVEELTDQHLLAEYRELFMVGSSLQRSLRSKRWPHTIAEVKEMAFTLNTGHVKFFYDKGLYLHKRYHQLRGEMIARGMTPDPERVFKRWQWPAELYNDWEPDDQALELIRQRIAERIALKPDWYRKTNENTKAIQSSPPLGNCNLHQLLRVGACDGCCNARHLSLDLVVSLRRRCSGLQTQLESVCHPKADQG